MTPAHRILVMAHGHPDFSLGGGEIAAYNLFKAYQDNSEVQDAWFLARADRGRGPSGQISLRRPNEYLWEQAVHDWHLMKAAHQESVTTWFADLIRALRPTVVHTHHYAHLGLEYLRVIKQVDPTIKIMMTLHEYMAICRNNGQMIKTGSFKLCSRATHDECHQCFPDRSPEDFWLRERYIKTHFDLVDHFVSPSQFLKGRYVAWGIAEAKISVIENGLPEGERIPPRQLAEGERRTRFGYFGQINPFKGVDLVIEAFAKLPKELKKEVTLDIYGSGLDWQTQEYKDRFNRLLDENKKVVKFHGAYESEEMGKLLQNIDWMVMGSIWWENSPVVIQEAFKYGRPIICPDIGGMKEKIEPEVNGYLFRARDALSLRNLVITLAEKPDKFETITLNGWRYSTVSHIANKHLSICTQL